MENMRIFLYIFQKSWILGTFNCISTHIDAYLCFFMFLHCLVKVLKSVHFHKQFGKKKLGEVTKFCSKIYLERVTGQVAFCHCLFIA